MDENAFQELGRGHDLSIPKSVEDGGLSSSDAVAVGRWGEQMVYSFYLEQSKQPESDILSVTWINQSLEKELPYDIDVTLKTVIPQDSRTILTDGDEVTNLRHVYVEVKSTLAEQKAFFELSYNQLKFAEDKADDFHIVRVYNVGKTETVKMDRLENLALKLKEKQVKLCMVI